MLNELLELDELLLFDGEDGEENELDLLDEELRELNDFDILLLDILLELDLLGELKELIDFDILPLDLLGELKELIDFDILLLDILLELDLLGELNIELILGTLGVLVFELGNDTINTGEDALLCVGLIVAASGAIIFALPISFIPNISNRLSPYLVA